MIRRQALQQLAGLAMLAVGAPALAQQTYPRHLSLSYRVKFDGIRVGQVACEMNCDATRVHYTRRIIPNFLGRLVYDRIITETSDFTLGPAGVMPLRYRRRVGDDVVTVDFDHTAGTIRYSNGKAVRLPSGVQDPVSILFAIAQQDTARNASIWLADEKKVREYRFIGDGREMIDTGAGRFGTDRVRRLESRKDREMVVWLADNLWRLPVQIRQIKKRNNTTLSLLKYAAD